MDNKKQAQKNPKQVKHQNVLETLKDVGTSTVNSAKKDLLEGTSKDFIRQLLNQQRRQQKVSGEIMPGESLEFKDVFSGKHEETVKLRKQVALERKLRQEEEARVEKKSGELKIQLHALQEEILSLTKTTNSLAKQTQVAAMQAPVEPGIYHVIFFEKLIEFVKSFRKKIQEAELWLGATNKRAEKKNYWARYKKHGSKFLLSPDHYLTRSAG